MTSRCSSVREKRPSGRSCTTGNSHATATTSATCSGGKTARATRARLVRQPLHAVLAEPSSPLADHFGVTVAAHRDVLVPHPLGRVEDQPRALHVAVGPRRRARTPLKLTAILVAELDPVTARPRHDSQFATPAQTPLHNSTRFRTRPLVAIADSRDEWTPRPPPSEGWPSSLTP